MGPARDDAERVARWGRDKDERAITPKGPVTDILLPCRGSRRQVR